MNLETISNNEPFMKPAYLSTPTEKQIQTTIIGYLAYRGYYVQRMNSGKLRQVSRTTNKEYMVNLSVPGTPDLLAIKNGRALWIEVKVKGNKPTMLQLAKMKELMSYGCQCVIAHSIADLIALGI